MSVQIGSEERVGSVLHVVRSIFYEGYNVKKIYLGQRKDGARVMQVDVAPYLHAGSDLIGRLQNEYHCPVEIAGNSEPLRPLSPSNQKWALDIIVADRPGMLARAFAALALRDMQVLDIQIGDVDSSTGPGCGPRHEIRVIFEKSDKVIIPKVDPRKDDFRFPKHGRFVFDFIAADLSSQPGFYSVKIAKLKARRTRRRPNR